MVATDDRRRDFDAWVALTDPGADFDGEVGLPMLTGSMAPAIPVGVRLRIVSARRRTFGVGDVVVFRRADRLVAHRLVLAFSFGRRALYLEKGDRNTGVGTVRRDEIRGVVTGWHPAGAPAEPVALRRSRLAALRSLAHGLRTRLREMIAPERRQDPAAGPGGDDHEG